MSPRFVLGRGNVPCVAEVVNRSLKADCTDFTCLCLFSPLLLDAGPKATSSQVIQDQSGAKSGNYLAEFA